MRRTALVPQLVHDLIACLRCGGFVRGGYGEAHARILNAFLRAWGGPADTGVYSLSLQQTAYN